MMTLRVFIVLLVLPWLADDGDKEGRRGNEFYAQQQYKLAVESYDRGLASLSQEAPRLLRYGLLNNLGAALLKSGDAQAAGEAFTRAMSAAPAPADVARTSYNAGNASFAAEDLESALQHYRKSLLTDPDNEDAKFNYEFVKRRLQEQQQEQQQQQQGDQQDQEGDQKQEGGDQNQEQDQDQQEQPQDGESQQDDGSQQDQQESPSEQQEQQSSREQPSPDELSDEQAERILQALQNEEEQLLRQVQRPKTRARQVEKDW